MLDESIGVEEQSVPGCCVAEFLSHVDFLFLFVRGGVLFRVAELLSDALLVLLLLFIFDDAADIFQGWFDMENPSVNNFVVKFRKSSETLFWFGVGDKPVAFEFAGVGFVFGEFDFGNCAVGIEDGKELLFGEIMGEVGDVESGFVDFQGGADELGVLFGEHRGFDFDLFGGGWGVERFYDLFLSEQLLLLFLLFESSFFWIDFSVLIFYLFILFWFLFDHHLIADDEIVPRLFAPSIYNLLVLLELPQGLHLVHPHPFFFLLLVLIFTYFPFPSVSFLLLFLPVQYILGLGHFDFNLGCPHVAVMEMLFCFQRFRFCFVSNETEFPGFVAFLDDLAVGDFAEFGEDLSEAALVAVGGDVFDD